MLYIIYLCVYIHIYLFTYLGFSFIIILYVCYLVWNVFLCVFCCIRCDVELSFLTLTPYTRPISPPPFFFYPFRVPPPKIQITPIPHHTYFVCQKSPYPRPLTPGSRPPALPNYNITNTIHLLIQFSNGKADVWVQQDRRWNADKPSAALDPYIPIWLTTSPANQRPANFWKSFFFSSIERKLWKVLHFQVELVRTNFKFEAHIPWFFTYK